MKENGLLLDGMKATTRKFTVLLEAAEEGGFVAKRLELPVATQGETREEAIKNVREAVEGYLEVRAGVLGKEKRERVEITVKQASNPVLA